MAKRLKTTVYADNPSGGLAKAFGPYDNVEEIPDWAKAQWGDHVWEEFDSSAAPVVEPSAEEKVNQFREELDSLRADNEDLRRERDELKARVAELEAQPAEGEAKGAGDETDLDSKTVKELEALAKERGVEVSAGAKKQELIDALRGQ